MPDTDTSTPPAGADQQQPPANDANSNGDAATPPAGDMDRQVADLRKESAGYRTKLRAAEAELDKLRQATLTEQEKAVDQARKEAADAARAEVLAELHGERKRNAILSAAAGKFADPDDAWLHLSDTVEVDDAGQVDAKKVAKAIDDLLQRKPHLRAGRPNGSAEGGARGTSPAGSDMSALIRQAAGRA